MRALERHESQIRASRRNEVSKRSPLPSAGEIDRELERKFGLPPFRMAAALWDSGRDER
jgi:hypothetical protein